MLILVLYSFIGYDKWLASCILKFCAKNNSLIVLKFSLYFTYLTLLPTPVRSVFSLRSFVFSIMSDKWRSTPFVTLSQAQAPSNWPPLLSNTHLRLFHVLCGSIVCSFWLLETMDTSQLLCPFPYQRTSWLLPVLVIMNKTVINVHVSVFI